MRHLGDPVATSLVVQDASKHLEQCSIELEKALAERKAGAEQLQLEGTASVDVVTVRTVGAKGSLLCVCVEIRGLAVEEGLTWEHSVQLFSRKLLRSLGRHMREHKMELA